MTSDTHLTNRPKMDNASSYGERIIMRAPPGQAARHIVDALHGAHRPGFYLASDMSALKAMKRSLQFLHPKMRLLEMPDWDCPPYSRISPSFGCMAARLGILCEMATPHRPDTLFLATAASAMQRVLPTNALLGSRLTLTVGQRIDDHSLDRQLSKLGFRQCSKVSERGEYAIRGGLTDVFPATATNPVRVDLFGDLVESIRIFDPSTQKTVAKTNQVSLSLVSEVVLSDDVIACFRTKFREVFGAPRGVEPIYEQISDGIRYSGMEHWLPLFFPGLETMFDYLPEAMIWTDEFFPQACESHGRAIEASFRSRQDSVDGSMRRKSSAPPPCHPDALFLGGDELSDILRQCATQRLCSTWQVTSSDAVDAKATVGRTFLTEQGANKDGLMARVASHIHAAARSDHVIIATASDGSRDRLRIMLEDEGVTGIGHLRPGASLTQSPGSINVAAWPLAAGFCAPGLTVIAETDIFGERLIRKSKRRTHPVSMVGETAGFMPGDLLVHSDYGIGRFVGLKTIRADTSDRDFFVLAFAGETMLYVPVENADLLTPYGAGEAPLDRLGTAAWQQRKASLVKDILAIADDLIAVAAERELNRAPIFTITDDSLSDFRSRCGFEDTDDQVDAEQDVLDDIASGKAMDRLICGDVGFGKTEIAMRAAFAVAASGGQVAVIAPTTLLARQHFETFSNRFRQYPIEVRQLSRMVSPTDSRAVRSGLENGTIDIVIGTHAVLSDRIKFRNLALMVIDEEQSFGVEQKEILKRACTAVHVLSMTATPIPRTLHMALSGVRDISLINSPPQGRQPIRTFVGEFDPSAVRNALLHESFRGGQSFVVVPRIKDLREAEEFLREWVPEIPFVMAHGRLNRETLEDRANMFYEGRCGIFLSTTIIASGIDIRNANTIIINKAERFGLAQLYQLRGRVGRGTRAAYAYVMHAAARHLTAKAHRRLSILGRLETLGMGHAVAAQDLEMRGGGNLLGDAQSGHVKVVGHELYQTMLADALNNRRAGDRPVITRDSWTPNLQLDVSATIPDSYIDDLEIRLGLYRRFSTLRDHEEIEAIGSEIIDRFGPLPGQLENLLRVLRMKIDCRAADIVSVEAGPRGAVLKFRPQIADHIDTLNAFLSARQDGSHFNKDGIFLPRRTRSAQAQIRQLQLDIGTIAARLNPTQQRPNAP